MHLKISPQSHWDICLFFRLKRGFSAALLDKLRFKAAKRNRTAV